MDHNQYIQYLTGDVDLRKQRAEQRLDQVIGNANDVLIRAQTVFPLTLFPTTITVDRSKITVTERNFLKSGEVLSIRIEDVLNVIAAVGPFFGAIKIVTRFFTQEKPHTVQHLWRTDALRIERIVQGYIIARQKNIDTSVLTCRELSDKLDELGNTAPQESI